MHQYHLLFFRESVPLVESRQGALGRSDKVESLDALLPQVGNQPVE
jgi:hypothetical protein